MVAVRFSLYLPQDAAIHFERYSRRQRLTNRAMVEAGLICVSAFCESEDLRALREELADVPSETLDDLIRMGWLSARVVANRQEQGEVRIEAVLDKRRYLDVRACVMELGLSMNAALVAVFIPWKETEDQRRLRWRIFDWAAERASQEDWVRRRKASAGQRTLVR